jgi:hypothetical protein
LVAGSALAGIGDRAIATLLDIVVAASPFAVIGMWAAVRWGELQGTAAAITISLVVILWFLYVWLLEGCSAPHWASSFSNCGFGPWR